MCVCTYVYVCMSVCVCVCMSESLFCIPKTHTTLQINYSSIKKLNLETSIHIGIKTRILLQLDSKLNSYYVNGFSVL